MFCPVCKAEYRFGFTRCADCDVDLVEHLSDAKEAAAPMADDSADRAAPELLWSGVDTGMFARIRAALDAAEIRYNDEPLEARLWYSPPRDPLEIWIHKADRDPARKILADVFGPGADQAPGGSGGEIENDTQRSGAIGMLRWAMRAVGTPDPATFDAEAEQGFLEAPDNIVDDFDPEEATIEVWSGVEKDMALMVEACLRENGIGCAKSEGADVTAHILVRPQDEKRAREIIREIIEAAPPV